MMIICHHITSLLRTLWPKMCPWSSRWLLTTKVNQFIFQSEITSIQIVLYRVHICLHGQNSLSGINNLFHCGLDTTSEDACGEKSQTKIDTITQESHQWPCDCLPQHYKHIHWLCTLIPSTFMCNGASGGFYQRSLWWSPSCDIFHVQCMSTATVELLMFTDNSSVHQFGWKQSKTHMRVRSYPPWWGNPLVFKTISCQKTCTLSLIRLK